MISFESDQSEKSISISKKKKKLKILPKMAIFFKVGRAANSETTKDD